MLNMLDLKNNSILQRGEKWYAIGHLNFYCALLVFIILPIHVKYIPPLMVLWVLLWAFENFRNTDFKKRFWEAKQYHRILFLFFVLYFLLQGLSILYSKNHDLAYSNLFGRLSLIVFPLVLFVPTSEVKLNVNLLLRVFVLAVSLYLVYCFGYALFRSLSLVNGEWQFNPHPEVQYLNYFYSTDLTVGQHPSYTAMYVLLSAFISFEFFYSKIKQLSRILWLVIGVLLMISMYFISSRAGLLIAFIFTLTYFPYKFLKHRYNRATIIGLVLLILLLIPVLLRNQRVDYYTGRFFNKRDYERKADPRFQLWKNSLILVKENFVFGVGIGDVRDELALVLRDEGQTSMAGNRYNAHNQFLEVLLETGIIGGILFTSIIVYMLWIAWKEHNLLYVLFILMMTGFFMFETVLYRFAGVSFFSIFSFFLLHHESGDISKSGPGEKA